MDKNQLSKWAAMLFGAILMGSAASASAKDLKMSLWFADKHFMVEQIFRPFVEDVKKATNGEVNIVIYSSAVLGNINNQASLVENGIADIAMIVPSYTRARFPLTESASLPFAFDNAAHGNRVFAKLKPYLDEEFKDFKFLFLTLNTPGALMTATKPIRRIEDLKGTRISGSGAAQQSFLQSLGAVSDFMPISEKYVAMERGTIEGSIMPLASAPGYKYEEVTKFINRWNHSATPLVVIMNKSSWSKLKPAEQKAIDDAAAVAGKKIGPAYDAEDEVGLKVMLAKGAKVVDFPPEDMEKLKSMANPFWDQYLNDLRGKTKSADKFMADFRAAIKETRQ